jgi:acyl carrier protein
MEAAGVKRPDMKQKQPIIGEINGFLSHEIEVDINRIEAHANFREVLELDSLHFIDLVEVIENKFSFKVRPEDFTRIISFQDFYTYILSSKQTKLARNAILEG